MRGRRSRMLCAGLVALISVVSVGLVVACDIAPLPPHATGVSTLLYGVNVDMTAMIPGTPYTITSAAGGNFFDLAMQLGINTIRVTDIQWEHTGQEYPVAMWRYVFSQAESHQMRVILLLSDGKDHSALQQARTLLGQYGLAQSPALWLVDLYNEPDVSDPQIMNALHEEAAYVHEVAPRTLVTVGGWKSQKPGNPGQYRWQEPADVSSLLGLVDVVSAHLYGFVEGAQRGDTPQRWTQLYLDALRQRVQGKPILLEEFGAGNGSGPGPAGEAQAAGSPGWQASVYCGVLQEVSVEQRQGVIGAVAWIIAPRPAQPGSKEGDLRGMAFVLANGSHVLPAAQVYFAVTHGLQC